LRAHIYKFVWHLDVDSSHPRYEKVSKGWAVRPLKCVRELGLERCETVRSLSVIVYLFKYFSRNTKGNCYVNQWWLGCKIKTGLVVKFKRITRFILFWEMVYLKKIKELKEYFWASYVFKRNFIANSIVILMLNFFVEFEVFLIVKRL